MSRTHESFSCVWDHSPRCPFTREFRPSVFQSQFERFNLDAFSDAQGCQELISKRKVVWHVSLVKHFVILAVLMWLFQIFVCLERSRFFLVVPLSNLFHLLLIQLIGLNCFHCQCSIELPVSILQDWEQCRWWWSWGCDGERQQEDNNRNEFGKSAEHGDHCFVNPTEGENDIVQGALHWCDGDVIDSGGQGVVEGKFNMITGETFVVKVFDNGASHFKREYSRRNWAISLFVTRNNWEQFNIADVGNKGGSMWRREKCCRGISVVRRKSSSGNLMTVMAVSIPVSCTSLANCGVRLTARRLTRGPRLDKRQIWIPASSTRRRNWWLTEFGFLQYRYVGCA